MLCLCVSIYLEMLESRSMKQRYSSIHSWEAEELGIAVFGILSLDLSLSLLEIAILNTSFTRALSEVLSREVT